MSAPNLELKETEFLSLGFLANSACHAIDVVLAGQELPEKDHESLTKAAAFLEDISSGADFIVSGTQHAGFNATRSLGALNFAMGPTESLKEIMKDDDVAKFFKDISAAVKDASAGAPKAQDQQHLEEAAKFFRAFYRWIMAELATRQPVLGPMRMRSSMFRHP